MKMDQAESHYDINDNYHKALWNEKQKVTKRNNVNATDKISIK